MRGFDRPDTADLCYAFFNNVGLCFVEPHRVERNYAASRLDLVRELDLPRRTLLGGST